MKSWKVIFIVATAVFLMSALAFAQQGAKPATRTLAKAAPPHSSSAPMVRHSESKGINADQVYKANCSRCHTAPHKLSDRATATIMRHMRVRANLTEEETKAILEYLTE